MNTKREICGSAKEWIPANVGLTAGATCRVKVVINKSTLLVLLVLACTFLMLNVAGGLYLYKLNRNHCQQLTDVQQQIEELREQIRTLQVQQLLDNDKGQQPQHMEDNEETLQYINTNSSSSLAQMFRYKRSAKGGSKNPKGLISIHLQGSQDDYRTDDGYIGAWQQRQWCTDCKGPKFVRDKGYIQIPVTGLYIVYAQITYNVFDVYSQFQIMMKDEKSRSPDQILGSCYSSKSDSEKSPVTCSTSLLLCLNKDNQIYVKTMYPDESLRLNEAASYFGLTRVAKMPRCLNP